MHASDERSVPPQAAVMKYGKNQWARISSLLTRKTPKQCKARWFEWLDPSIKKTEWSKEEDEKLLHLAKLMPTQWRTIAPIVGRTPSQCLERYQRLLDEAEAKEADPDAGPSADDVRRLRPGEIDPEPESKPARPDPIDMDEDEKEMLSEARARLANTQGKKAKRKAREKALEEARRLASLQKRRELKAAGIEVHAKKKKRGMDYNADIPFHVKAPIGFYDVSNEKAREVEERESGLNVLLSKLEGKRRQDVEEDEKKRDAKRHKTMKEKGDYVPPQAIREAQLSAQTSVRKKLTLPAPQVGDGEIEELLKIGSVAEAAKAIVDTDDTAASKALLSDYSAMKLGGNIRTPRTPAVGDSLKQQARNLRAMEHSQTPLLGGNIELEGEEALVYQPGATPRGGSMPTPNPLAAQLTPRGGSVASTPRSSFDGGSTPRGGIFGRTPVRDEIGINTPRSTADGFDETPRGERSRQGMIRHQLSAIWKTLPSPKNEFDIVIPDAPRPDADDDMEVSRTSAPASGKDEDMADIEARSLRKQAEAERIERLLSSSAVQRALPRPLLFTPEILLENPTDGNDPEELVLEEMKKMILRDISTFPSQGQLPHPKVHVEPESVSLPELKVAQSLIDAELAEMNLPEIESFATVHEEETSRYTFIRPQSTSGGPFVPGRFEPKDKVTVEDLVSKYTKDLEFARDQMKKEHAASQKLEKRLGVVLGGYVTRSAKLRRDLFAVVRELEEGAIKLESFRRLKADEEITAQERLEKLRKEVAVLERRERDGQERYRMLLEERDRRVLASRHSAVQNGIGGEETGANGAIGH
ncbi:CDC5 cell division cycle 5-like protein [Dinochytrium kinnereticum]|nr:CDC5 cell division cycle 5-like protein [Dinochytrium kinnereticum]